VTLLSMEHPIQEELFWTVYDHLKDIRPDGTPTNRVRLVRYSKRMKSERAPLLTFDGPYYPIRLQPRMK
jgi:hypothetical protein